jgi:AcrR family transcriptional regulator
MGRNAIIKQRNANPKKKEFYILKLTKTFKQFGLKRYNMDSIAAELNISKATLYHYFSSKDEMIEQVLMHVIAQLAGFENIANNKNLTFEKRFYSILELFSNTITDISTIMLADLQEDYPMLWKQVQLFIQHVNEVLTNFYNDGKKEGFFVNINTSILVMSDTMFFNAISDVNFLKNNNISLRTAFDEYFRMKCFGFIKQ